MSEIAREDVQQFIRMNDLIAQAARVGLTLRKPDGTPYRHCRIVVIEPDEGLGDTIDFSPSEISRRYDAGRRCVRKLMEVDR
jgi:NTE family protein